MNFAEAISGIAAKNLNTPVCLFLGALPSSTATLARRAWNRDIRYVSVGAASFIPLVCVLWPKEKAQEFLFWAESARGMTRADDGNAAKWARATKQQILATVPSLVQHDDGEVSVKGGRAHKPWAESWRQAFLLAEDALDYEW